MKSHDPLRAEAVVCAGDTGINALATARSLARRGVRVRVVHVAGSRQIASASRYCAVTTKISHAQALPEALLALHTNRNARPVLFVDNDPMMKLLAPHAPALGERFAIVDAIADAPRLTDKAFQLQQAQALGIPVPRTWFPKTWDDFDVIGRASARALIAKPSPSRLDGAARPQFKTVTAADAKALGRSLRGLVLSPADVLVQEYIEGGDEQIYVALCYRAKSRGRTFVLSARKLRQLPPRAGVMALGQALDVPQVRDMTRGLARAVDLHGVLSTEFKFDQLTQRYYFIEWNPRPAYFHSIGWKAGFDLAWLAYCDHVAPDRLQYMHQDDSSSHYWINVRADAMHLAAAPRLALQLRTWTPYFSRKEWAVFALDDPAPWAKATRQFAGALSGSALRAARRRLQRADRPAVQG